MVISVVPVQPLSSVTVTVKVVVVAGVAVGSAIFVLLKLGFGSHWKIVPPVAPNCIVSPGQAVMVPGVASMFKLPPMLIVTWSVPVQPTELVTVTV